MRFYWFLLFITFLLCNHIAFGQRSSTNVYLNESIYKNIAKDWYKGSDINLIYWGVNFNDYKFRAIFDETLNYGIIDTISEIISVEKKTIIDSYNNWDIEEGELFRKQISFIDNRVSDSILRANAIKDEDQLINQWGEDSLIILNRTIEFFGLLYLPDGYILTAVRTYCLGKCGYEFIAVFRQGKNRELKLVFANLLGVT